MKSTIKLVLAFVLFSSAVFADDGDLGNGSKTCTSNCFTATQPTEVETKSTAAGDSILTTVQEYLDSFFKYFKD